MRSPEKGGEGATSRKSLLRTKEVRFIIDTLFNGAGLFVFEVMKREERKNPRRNDAEEVTHYCSRGREKGVGERETTKAAMDMIERKQRSRKRSRIKTRYHGNRVLRRKIVSNTKWNTEFPAILLERKGERY